MKRAGFSDNLLAFRYMTGISGMMFSDLKFFSWPFPLL